MAMKAKITLQGSMSHTRGGRTFRKGQTQILTNSSEIMYYQSQPGFRVNILEGETQAVPIPSAAGASTGPGSAAPELVIHSRDKLKGMKKKDLLAVADSLEILLTGDEKKADMIDAIMEAQEALDSDEDEDGEE